MISRCDIEKQIELYKKYTKDDIVNGSYYYWCSLMGLDETLRYKYPIKPELRNEYNEWQDTWW